MKPNKLIRLALWLSRYSWSTMTVSSGFGIPEARNDQMIVIGRK